MSVWEDMSGEDIEVSATVILLSGESVGVHSDECIVNCGMSERCVCAWGGLGKGVMVYLGSEIVVTIVWGLFVGIVGVLEEGRLLGYHGCVWDGLECLCVRVLIARDLGFLIVIPGARMFVW